MIRWVDEGILQESPTVVCLTHVGCTYEALPVQSTRAMN